MEKRVRLTPEPIPVDILRRERPEDGGSGGYVSFEGVVRAVNDGKDVTRLDYEAFAPLALKELHRIVDEVGARSGVRFIEVVHRVGTLRPGDVAVFIQVYAAHRREAFRACEAVIDTLKSTVPIWKKEFYADGSHAWPHCPSCAPGHHHV